MTENQIEGTAKNVAGKVKEAVGDLTGNTKTQVEGQLDQASGMAQTAYAQAKDAVSSATDTAQSTISTVAERVGRQASTLKDSASTQASRAADYASSHIKDEPMMALVLVGVFGMLIGYLLGRPQREHAIELGRFRAAYRDR